MEALASDKIAAEDGCHGGAATETLRVKCDTNFEVPILSFFTGLGLLDLGFHKAGFESIWHNEFSPEFARGFQYGMESLGLSGPPTRIQNSQSIVDIGPNQILRDAVGSSGKPELIGIIGGPPCLTCREFLRFAQLFSCSKTSRDLFAPPSIEISCTIF